MTRDRDQNVPREPAVTAPPQGPGVSVKGRKPRVTPTRASRARDYTPPPTMRSPKSLPRVADINHISDPPMAVGKMWDYMRAVLVQAENRNPLSAYAWCWFLIHLFDLAGHAIENRAEPGPWFRDRHHWHLEPDGRKPARPVAELVYEITRTEASDD